MAQKAIKSDVSKMNHVQQYHPYRDYIAFHMKLNNVVLNSA